LSREKKPGPRKAESLYITEMQRVNLFCLPFAGGSRYSYRLMKNLAPGFLQVFALDYPGRGKRTHEAFLTDIDALTEDIYDQIHGVVDGDQYAIYGHSMGGLLLSLVTRKLMRAGHKVPLHLFVTGTSGPSAPSRGDVKRHLMEKEEFIEEIRKLDGSPQEILGNTELLDYLEPILRADFAATENYVYQRSEPVDIPITVITGSDEDMEPEDIQLWQAETRQRVDFRIMPGKHFFIFDHAKEIMDIISTKVLKDI
jgi:surfactin synthase thioesterase subunit